MTASSKIKSSFRGVIGGDSPVGPFSWAMPIGPKGNHQPIFETLLLRPRRTVQTRRWRAASRK